MRPVNRKGALLVSVLVSIGILGGFVLITSHLAGKFVNEIGRQVHLGEVDDLRRFVLASASCEKTISTELSHCNGTDSIRLFKENCGQVHDPASPTLIGGVFSLKANCRILIPGATPVYGLNVEYQRMTGPGVPAVDPVSKEPYLAKDLFDGVPLPCAPIPPAPSDYVFLNRKFIDAFYLQQRSTVHPEFPPLGSTSPHAHNDPQTATAICALKGCTSFVKKLDRQFKSPKDDYIYYWIPANSNFILKSAKVHNHYMNYLSCAGCAGGGGAACP